MLVAAEGEDSSTSLPPAVLAVLGFELTRQGTLRIANARDQGDQARPQW